MSLHELAAELGVSRSPVHHALTRLVSEGLLSVKSRRGYYVTPLTEVAVVEGYDVRLALELRAAESRGRPRVRVRAGRRFQALQEASAEAVSHAEWDAANAAFHEHQVDLAGNSLLSRFYRELSVNLMMQVIRGGKLEGGAYLATEHEAIVDAVRGGGSRCARTAIRAHIATRPPDRARGDRGAAGVL